jgi:hypothetical protein
MQSTSAISTSPKGEWAQLHSSGFETGLEKMSTPTVPGSFAAFFSEGYPSGPVSKNPSGEWNAITNGIFHEGVPDSMQSFFLSFCQFSRDLSHRQLSVPAGPTNFYFGHSRRS